MLWHKAPTHCSSPFKPLKFKLVTKQRGFIWAEMEYSTSAEGGCYLIRQPGVKFNLAAQHKNCQITFRLLLNPSFTRYRTPCVAVYFVSSPDTDCYPLFSATTTTLLPVIFPSAGCSNIGSSNGTSNFLMPNTVCGSLFQATK